MTGLYSYLDDVGERHSVRYAAGAGTGYQVTNAVPDTPSLVKYSAPLYKSARGASARGKVSYERGPGGQYKFIATAPDQRRSESTGADGVTRGSYSYLDDKGVQRTVEYIAGAGIGYKVLNSATGPGTHLRPRPAIPQFGLASSQATDVSDAEGTGFKRGGGSGTKVSGFDASRRAGQAGSSSGTSSAESGDFGGSFGKGSKYGGSGTERTGSGATGFGSSGAGSGFGSGASGASGGSGGASRFGGSGSSSRFGGSSSGAGSSGFGSSGSGSSGLGGSSIGSGYGSSGGGSGGGGGRIPMPGNFANANVENDAAEPSGRPGKFGGAGRLSGSSAAPGGFGQQSGSSFGGGASRYGSSGSAGGGIGSGIGSSIGSGINKDTFGSGSDGRFGGTKGGLGGGRFGSSSDSSSSAKGTLGGTSAERDYSQSSGERTRPGSPSGAAASRPLLPIGGQIGGVGAAGDSDKSTNIRDGDSPSYVTSNGASLAIDRHRDWTSSGRDSTIVTNVGQWYVGLPPGSAVRAHVQNIDLLPVGGRPPSPGEALRKDEKRSRLYDGYDD